MPVDGSLNPSATYVEEDNAPHTPPGGRYQVTRGYKETWALTDPVRPHADPAEAATAPVKFYTGIDTGLSEPPP